MLPSRKLPGRFLLTSHLSLLTAFLLLCFPAVVLAQWEPEVRLTFNPQISRTADDLLQFLAASGDTVHLVWFDTRDTTIEIYEIYYKRSTDGGLTWGPDLRMTAEPADSRAPSIAASGAYSMMVWYDKRDGSNGEIYFRKSDDGGLTWSPDTRLTYDPAYSSRPSVALSGMTAHVFWGDSRTGLFEIFYKRSTDNGSTWTPDTQLTGQSGITSWPFAVSEGPHVEIIWYDTRDGTYEIYTKRSLNGGSTWGPDERLTHYSSWKFCPALALSGANIHVAWSDGRHGQGEIYYKRSTDGGTTWGSDTRLTFDDSASVNPTLATLGPMVHLVWEDWRHGVRNPEVYHRRSTDGGLNWEPEERLTFNPGHSWYPALACGRNKVHVVWCDDSDGNYEIYYKRNPNGNSGVQEGIVPAHASRLMPHAIPNPFVNFTTLPGHASDRFVLYDISGRQVGVWKGDRVGEGLPAGVYFLRPEGKYAAPLRIVKLR